jgi:spore maturation protein CgeB
MKFVIFGLTISSSWGNGHATLWRGLCRALAQRGHRVVFFERDVPYYAEHRDLADWRDGELRLFSNFNQVRYLARKHLADADVAIVTSYCPDALVATDLVLASRAGLKVFYDLDTPVTLDSMRAGATVAYVGPRGLGDFDLVLSYTGGRALDELRSKLGARRVAPLYGSVDPEAHHRVASDPRFACDLSYLGTYAGDRQAALEELFLAPARRRPQRRFLIGGALYPPDFPWTENLFFVQHVDPGQHPAFFSSSRLTLNVTRRAMKEMGYCPSGRLFEAAACGAPLLSDDWEGLGLFLAPGSEILVARNADEAVAAMDASDETLAAVARRARERVLDEHTAAHRARHLETIIENTARAPEEAQLAEWRAPLRGPDELVEA